MTDHDDWLAWRRGGIGASDVAGIINKSPHASPYTVWLSKVDPSFEVGETAAMTFGKYAERMFVPWFRDLTGLHIIGEQTPCEHPHFPWHRATVDGFVAESPDSTVADALGVWEAKTSGPGAWDDIPDHYFAQVLWQLHVTGHQHAWVGHLHGRRLDIHEVDADGAAIAWLVEQVDRFWHDHVIANVPPPVTGHPATLKALASIPADPTLTVELDPDVYWRWRTAVANARHAADLEKHARAALEAALDAATVGTLNGEPVVTWSEVTTRRVAGLRDISGIDPDLVRRLTAAGLITESTHRRLTNTKR